MIGGCLFAVLVGADPGWLAILMARYGACSNYTYGAVLPNRH